MQWNQAVRQLRQFSQTETVRESLMTFTSTAINGFLGILYYFYLAKILDPDIFGKTTIFISAVILGYSICNFGLDQSIIRYKLDSKILSNIVGLKILTSIVVSTLFIALFGFNNIFGLVGFGIASNLMFTMSVTFLQSWQNYTAWSILYISTNAARLFIALMFNSPDQYFHVTNFIVMPMLGYLAFALIYRNKLPTVQISYHEIKKMLAFNLPLSINSIISAFIAKIDGFFIASFQSFAQAGVYNLAVQIAIFPHFVTAYSAVTAPKFKQMGDNADNAKYLKKTTLFAAVIALLLMPILMIVAAVFFHFSNIDINSNYSILILLFVGYAIFFASVPLRDSLLYYFGDSKIFSYLSAFTLLISILSGFLLIRPFGPIAAASSFLFIQTISVLILVYKFKYENSRPHHR